MKYFKSIFSLALVLAMLLALGCGAFASGEASGGPVAASEIEDMIAGAEDDAALAAVYKRLAIAWKAGNVVGEDGAALPADCGQAADYFCLAGALGDGYNYFDAGQLYEQGLVSGAPDYEAAMKCYILAAGSEITNCKGVRNIGQWYETGNSLVEQDYRMAAAFYRWAILLDDVSSLSYMGNLYREGCLSPDGAPDYENAALYYQQAADRGNDSAGGVAKSLYQLGLMYENGLGVDADLDAARAMYQRAVDAGESKLEELYPDAVAALARVS